MAGLLIALPTLKMTGIYLAIVTLGFSEITRLTVLNWESLTGGPLGIKGIPVPRLFTLSFRNSRNYYYLFLVTAFLFLFVTERVVRSQIGRAWMSIREDLVGAQNGEIRHDDVGFARFRVEDVGSHALVAELVAELQPGGLVQKLETIHPGFLLF